MGFWPWSKNRRRRTDPASVDPAWDTAHEHCRLLVRTGFESRDDIVRTVREILQDEGVEDIREDEVFGLVDGEIRDLTDDQSAWPEVTDCDRLRAAFDSLRRSGIWARHHYSCCGTCGNLESMMDLEYLDRAGESHRGYAFYHVQDTENAVTGGGLYLSYGDYASTDEGSLAVGHEIVDAIRKQGLETDWDGTIQNRIYVQLDWKHRWPPSPSEAVLPEAVELWRSRTGAQGRLGHG